MQAKEETSMKQKAKELGYSKDKTLQSHRCENLKPNREPVWLS
jgi:hypothetical protein